MSQNAKMNEILLQNSRLHRENEFMRQQVGRWETLCNGMTVVVLTAVLGLGLAVGFWMGAAKAGGF